jgi:uncharacterized membrane protein HdeD (DUF308 family)
MADVAQPQSLLTSVAGNWWVLVFRGAGLLSLLWLIGLYALIFGVALIFLGLRIRRNRMSSRVS